MGRSKASQEMESLGTCISVRLPSGQLLSLTLHKFDQMSKVYNLVATETGSKHGLIRIKFTGKTLQQTQVAHHLGIMEGMVLKAEVIVEREINVTLKIDDKDPLVMKVWNTNTVQGLKTLLNSKELLQNKDCQIFFGTKELVVQTTMLYDAKIGNNSTLVVKSFTKKEPEQPTIIKASHNQQQSEAVEVIPAFSAEGKTVEVVFSFDTTGSMYAILQQVRDNLQALIDRLINDIPNIRIGLIAQGDYCDYNNYVIKTHDLSGDAESLKQFAMNVPATGGGDAPEAYELSLRKAQELDWSEDSAKALVVIGDCAPHPPSYTDQAIYWHDELDILCGMGIKVYGVQAFNNNNTISFYKELADRTNGAYVKFDNFSLIKDMFLAVCYNESSEDHLEEFMTELQQDGAMSEQKKEIFDQLKDQQQAVREDRAADIVELRIAFDPRQSQNYVAVDWFDRSLDGGRPDWTYVQQSDKWGPLHRDAKQERAPRTHDSYSLTPHSTSNKKNSRRWRGLASLSCFK